MLHSHDISDKLWEKIEKILPGSEDKRGRPAENNRRFINAVFWILRTGAPWRDLPPEYGEWKNTHRRFSRWRDKGIWEKILEIVEDNPDTEWIMIDSTYCKCHQHAAGARGGNEAIGLTKGGETRRYMWPWMRLVCRSERLLQTVPLLIAKKLSNCSKI